jgi:hypothetical protein
MRFEKSAKLPCKPRIHQRPLNGAALPGIDDQSAPHEYPRVVISHRIDHGPALGKTSSRGKADHQSRARRTMDRRFGSRGNHTARRKKRSVKVDGNHFVLHAHTIADSAKPSKSIRSRKPNCKFSTGYPQLMVGGVRQNGYSWYMQCRVPNAKCRMKGSVSIRHLVFGIRHSLLIPKILPARYNPLA